MNLFPSIISDPILGWLANESEPWKLVDRQNTVNISAIIEDLISSNLETDYDKYDHCQISGLVFIHDSAMIGPNVQIQGPVFIGRRAEIRHSAFLRPGCYISEDCVVGHSSEIKNTLMMPKSKAPHFNYVGDSIIGVGANIGAGVKISNFRLDKKTIPIENNEGQKVDSGMKKLGALVGDHSAIGCNVVTNPGSILPPNSMVPPNTTVSGYWKQRL